MSSGAKAAGMVVAWIITAVALAGLSIYLVSQSRLNEIVDVPEESIEVRSDATALQHGQHVAGAIARCAECHGASMAGKVVFDDASARIVAPNLTAGAGGVGAIRSDVDIARAIRDGVAPGGRLLLLMPSDDYNRFSDADLGALVAYVRSLPRIDHALPSSQIRPLGRALLAAGQRALIPAANIDSAAERLPPPAPDVTAAYGEYLAATAGCAKCHGPGLAGGAVPGAPRNAVPASDITPAHLGHWSEADFLRVMRTGRRPDGTILDDSMPWQVFAQMTEIELRALWQFLGVI